MDKDLEKLIQDLLQSDMISNQELGVTLLTSPDFTYEEKKKYIDDFIKQFLAGKIDFDDPERKEIFKTWIEIYTKSMTDDKIKKDRVNKIH